MSDSWIQGLIATVIGIGFTVLARFIDRVLPDPEGHHPLPTPNVPGGSTSSPGTSPPPPSV